MPVKPIPDGYHSATPYLILNDPAAAIDFYIKAFGASELFRMPGPDGKIVHAEVKVGDSPIMMGCESPERGYLGPLSLGGSPVGIMLYVDDVDKTFKQAIAAGGTQMRPVEDQFYGDRSGTLKDPFGHTWTVSTHKEDLSPEEIQKRAEASMKS
jgi:PhnB protein